MQRQSKHKYDQISTKLLLPSHARLVVFGGTPLHPCGMYEDLEISVLGTAPTTSVSKIE